MPGAVAELVTAVLAERPDGAQVRELAAELRRRGTAIPRARLEATLAGDATFAARDVLGRTVWSLTAPPSSSPVRTVGGLGTPVRGDRPLDGLELRDWQVDAFAAWAAAGCRGVVEAITGTGKTRLGIAAIRVALGRGGRALVLVPTLDLQDQWCVRLRAAVPEARVGRLGGGHDDDLHDHHVLVATPHSAAQVPLDVPSQPGLLVADEAHRYGAPTWGAALSPAFPMRLALTATYERNDEGLEEVLGPYFGGVVARYGYVEATRDGVIAPFRVALVGTELDPAERDAYDAADQRVRQLRSRLVELGLPRHPLELIAAAAGVVARGEGSSGRGDPKLATARGFLGALRARRDVAAQAAGKLDVVRVVAPALRDRRTLVFTDTVEQAEQATRLLAAAGVEAEEIHGGLADRRRRIRMAQFRNGNLSCVVAPRVLDEGVDVPEADVAVVLAAFRTRRQMIQRLGRVLRLKPDGSEARLVIAYAKGTREDPADGAHEEFLHEVLPVAREVVTLDADAGPEAVRTWLS